MQRDYNRAGSHSPDNNVFSREPSISGLESHLSNKDNLRQYLTNKFTKQYRSLAVPQEIKTQILDQIRSTVTQHVRNAPSANTLK